MDDPTSRRLAQIERDVAALRTRSRRRSPRPWLLAGLLITLLALSPLGALAANFVDLNPGSGHNANINAIADAGISRGCVADGSRYCPNETVTREQMASFLARTAGLGGNPPVVNALTAVTAQTATNATQVGGLAPDTFVQKSGDLVFEIPATTAITDDPALSFTFESNNVITMINASAPGAHAIVVPLAVPSQLFGVPLRITGLTVCSSVSNAATKIDTTLLKVVTSGGFVTSLNNTDDRNTVGFSCATVPVTMNAALNGVPHLELGFDYNDASHTIRLSRIAVTMSAVP